MMVRKKSECRLRESLLRGLQDLLRGYLWPHNPIGVLCELEGKFKAGFDPKERRAILSALQPLVNYSAFSVHPRAWKRFVKTTAFPRAALPEVPPEPKGWPVPIILPRGDKGGVVHLKPGMFRSYSLAQKIDLGRLLETILNAYMEINSEALILDLSFPDCMEVPPEIEIQGESYELSAILGVFASQIGNQPEPVFATSMVFPDGRFGDVEGFEQKIQGWLREVGPGTKALVLPSQEKRVPAEVTRQLNLKVVNSVTDVIDFMESEGWLRPYGEPPDLLRLESCVKKVDEWVQRKRPEMALLTARALKHHKSRLLPRQKVMWLSQMHYLQSHFGRFPEGLHYLSEMLEELEANPDLLGRDEKAIHLAKAAVQLYDAHRFEDAESILRPLLEEGLRAQLSPLTRAKVLGTLGQVCTAVGKFEEGKEILEEAIGIFQEADPQEVSRSYHYLIHNRLRAGDLDKAQRLLHDSEKWMEQSDYYGHLFREFYRHDIARRLSEARGRPTISEGYAGLIHPYCFALQAWARNPSHQLEQRVSVMAEAAERLEGLPQTGGVLQFLAYAYRMYQCALDEKMKDRLSEWVARWRNWIQETGGEPYKRRYDGIIRADCPSIEELETLFDTIPYH